MSIPAVLQGRLALPVIAAPLFIISNPALVIAQCTSGVVGAFPALNARPRERLEDWLIEISDALAAWMRRILSGRRRLSPSTRSCTARTRGSSMIWRCA